MLPYSRPRILPPIPPLVRLGLVGVAAAAILYVTVFATSPPVATRPEEAVELKVAIPSLDRTILAKAKDDTREQRLIIEPEPLRHLLEVAIDVGPTVAAALGMPENPVPIAQVRADLPSYRGRWLWYKGELEELNGPREGHPVKGYSIYEATLRLADSERVICAFSIAPGADVHRGGIVRVEGYLLKLRDTTYPHDITQAPMLVGRQIQHDYEDWPPVRQLDQTLFEKLGDDDPWRGTKAWHTIDEDQGEPLWHIGAFVRDTAAQRSFAEWRKIGTLNWAEVHPKLEQGLERGTPLRILGSLIRRTTIAAPANPAGIKFWTVAYVQVRDYDGRVVPVWIPKRVADLPLRAGLEIKAHYYRWFAYETQQGDKYRVPLFVAADLDEFVLETKAMREVGIGIGILLILMMAMFWWMQRRSSRQSLQHAREMDERRRRRRERQGFTTANSPPPAATP